MFSTIRSADWARYAAQAIVAALAGYALFISFGHITEFAHFWGVEGDQANAAPFFVDGLMILGRLGMFKRWTDRTNKIGRGFLVGGAILSFAANIGDGHTIGGRVFGALIVAGFVACEWYAGSFESRKPEQAEATPAPIPAPAVAPAAKPKATRKPTARKCPTGCTCGKHAPRKAKTAKTATSAAPKAPTYVPSYLAVPANAPVSPAVSAAVDGAKLTPSGIWVASATR
jgi:hypothetical protein